MMRSAFSQDSGQEIHFRGIVLDQATFTPVTDVQISLNGAFISSSGHDGTFELQVHKKDTIRFMHLGYKPVVWHVSDTLRGSVFATGIYMSSDTVSIGEVVIVPRNLNLRYEIMNSPSKMPSVMENAKYNVAVSGYIGRTTTGNLVDASSNYSLVRQQQRVNAQEKGTIPSDKMVGLSPFSLIPAAILLIKGTPKPEPMEKTITRDELERIQKKYFEMENRK
jgi:hypothetical protein